MLRCTDYVALSRWILNPLESSESGDGSMFSIYDNGCESDKSRRETGVHNQKVKRECKERPNE